MKFTKYFMPLAAVALLASCSNDNLDGPNVGPNNSGNTVEAYAAFDIAMPALNGTRAVTNPEGEAAEYKVNGGTVYIFEAATGATSEDEYTFVTKGDLDVTVWAKDGNDQVTTSSKTAVAKFGGLTLDNVAESNYYALVVLNTPVVAVGGYQHPTAPVAGASGSEGTPGQTFGTWKAQVLPSIEGDADNGFTMTNSPKATPQDNISAVTTLVKIDAQYISTSPNNLHPAATIYVQRVASKVTITPGEKTWDAYDVELPQGVSSGTKDQIIFSDWGLNYTNKKTYAVQMANNYLSGTSSWFTGTAPTHFTQNLTDGTNAFARIWWAEDPNYDETYTTDAAGLTTHQAEFTVVDDVDSDLDDALYCLENTMKWNKQYKNQSTQFVIKGQYILKSQLQTSPISFISCENWQLPLTQKFYKGNEEEGAEVLQIVQVDNEDTDTPDAPATVDKYQTGAKNLGLNDLFEMTGAGKTAYRTLLNGTKQPSDEGYIATNSDLSPEQLKDGVIYFIQKTIALTDTDNIVVDYYKDGVVYYAMPIRHFEDEELDMTTNSITEKNGITKYTEAHLGRFGMLRNNWYEVVVNKVSGLGEPIVPTPKDTDPDDPDDKQYMDVTIKILNWAKRSHSYDL